MKRLDLTELEYKELIMWLEDTQSLVEKYASVNEPNVTYEEEISKLRTLVVSIQAKAKTT
jgi:hypothetical protein